MLGYKTTRKICQKTFTEELDITVGTWCLLVCFWCYILFRFTSGLGDANDPEKCRLHSIGDFAVAPFYTVGCNVGKDRFDIKVN